jgi:hypothetical protein
MLMNRFFAILASVFCLAAHDDAQRPLFAPAPANVGAPGSGEVFLVDLNHDRHLDLVTKHLLRQRLASGPVTARAILFPPLKVRWTLM